MDARGLLAVVITVHEGAFWLALLIGAACAIVAAAALRNAKHGVSASLLVLCAASALSYAVATRVLDVTGLDVEVIRAR